MGSGGSSKASAFTYVETEASSFSPGGEVAGVVKILAEKATKGDQMKIVLSCISETKWTQGKSFTSRDYHERRVLNTVSFPVWNFGGTLPQGQYTLPFKIQLPNPIMPSFNYKLPDRLAKIDYVLEAVVEGSKDVKPQMTVIWISKFPKHNQPIAPVNSEANIKVSTWLCLKSGTVELKSTISSNVVMSTEDLTVSSKVVNIMNKFTVNKITCRLTRRIRLKANVNSKKHSKVFQEEISSDVSTIDIKPTQSVAPDIIQVLLLKQKTDLWMQPTLESELIDCEYIVKVTLNFDNMIGCGAYSVMLPIEICNGMVVVNTRFSPPPMINIPWNPMMLSPVPIQAHGYNSQLQHQNYSMHETTMMIDPNSARGPWQLENGGGPKHFNHQ
jgi:hypothetical protein